MAALKVKAKQDFSAYLEEIRRKVDRWLDLTLPSEASPPRNLHAAMRHSVLSGGKRLRPALVLLADDAFGGEEAGAWPAACAVEMIHTYSLIHDDLPCMDDGKLRRGKPCCHRLFGEAVAVLAGDALLTAAFGLLAKVSDPRISRELVRILDEAGGWKGMVGGQVEDLEAEGKPPDLATVDRIHQKKTAALIAASLEMGAVCARADEKSRARVRAFGRDVGLAFQIVDDLLDVTGTEKALGKSAGGDGRAKKMTYPACIGLGKARSEARALAQRAEAKAVGLGAVRPGRFQALARFVVERVT